MKFKYWSHLIILFLAIFVRFVNLDKVPSALYYDEIDLGYQIRSFLQTGKDYRGNLSPFYFRSFNTDKTPLPVYFSAMASTLFKSPEYQVRAGTAFAGVGVVLLSMILVFQLTKSKKASLIAGLVFTFSPWLIHFSRLAFEAEFALFFLLLFWTLINYWLETKSRFGFWGSAIALGLSVYTYRTMGLTAPAILIISPICFYKDFKKEGVKKTLLWVVTVLIFILPFIYATTVGSKDQTRISQISIFSDSMTPIEIQRSRELESGDYQNPVIGRNATFLSKAFHNKPLSYLEIFTNNTLRNFSPEFLFITGDPNGRHSAKNSGELLIVDILGLLVGAYFVFQKIKDKRFLFLLIILFVSAVPANLTLDGANHASRLIAFSGPLLIMVSLGYYYLFSQLKRTLTGKIILTLLFFGWLFFASQFLNRYFLHFPIQNSREFGYGFKQAIQKILTIENQFQHLALTDDNDPPILYYLYWANISPSEIQKYGTELGDEIIKNLLLDKVKPYHPEMAMCNAKVIVGLLQDTLYMVSFRDLPLDFRSADKDKVPDGIKLIDVIKYPDNEVAFYLITRDTKNGQAVLPSKLGGCKKKIL